jgi:ketosteroid isomerase-like protein
VASAGGGVEQAIMQFENERLAATLNNDPAYFERVLADDYMGTGLSGEVTDKAQTIANTKAGDPKFESLSYEDQKVRVYGDTAVATGRAILKGKVQGQDINGPVRFTRVYAKRDGNWQLVAFQVTRVAKP